jgi:hypothetical protein
MCSCSTNARKLPTKTSTSALMAKRRPCLCASIFTSDQIGRRLGRQPITKLIWKLPLCERITSFKRAGKSGGWRANTFSAQGRPRPNDAKGYVGDNSEKEPESKLARLQRQRGHPDKPARRCQQQVPRLARSSSGALLPDLHGRSRLAGVASH